MALDNDPEWTRLNAAWVRRAMCEAIDDIVAKLVALQEIVNALPEEPRLDQCSPPKGIDAPDH